MFDQMFGKFDQIFGAIQIDEGCFCRSGELSVEAKNSRTNGLFCIWWKTLSALVLKDKLNQFRRQNKCMLCQKSWFGEKKKIKLWQKSGKSFNWTAAAFPQCCQNSKKTKSGKCAAKRSKKEKVKKEKVQQKSEARLKLLPVVLRCEKIKSAKCNKTREGEIGKSSAFQKVKVKLLKCIVHKRNGGFQLVFSLLQQQQNYFLLWNMEILCFTHNSQMQTTDSRCMKSESQLKSVPFVSSTAKCCCVEEKITLGVQLSYNVPELCKGVILFYNKQLSSLLNQTSGDN